NIVGAPGATYAVTEGNENHQLRVIATTLNQSGAILTATSAPTAAVIDITPTISLSVTGTAQEGQVLSALVTTTNDGDGSITYRWQRLVGSNWVAIAGATSATYRAAEADEGFSIRVVATFTNDTGQSATATSTPTAP